MHLDDLYRRKSANVSSTCVSVLLGKYYVQTRKQIPNYSHEILPLIKLKQESDKTWNLSERDFYLHPAAVTISSDYSFYNQIFMISYS